MTPEFASEAMACLVIFSGFMIVLGIGAFIADVIFPRIPFLNRWLDSLPDYEDDDEAYEQYRAECRARRIARQRKLAARKGRR